MPISNKRRHPAAFKAKVALEVIRREDELAAIASQYQIHPTQARRWKRQLLAGVTDVFSTKSDDKLKKSQELTDQLYQQIGQQKVEIDWLKKISQTIS